MQVRLSSIFWLILIPFVALASAEHVAVSASADARTLTPGLSFRDCANCPEMIVIPSGSFLMGSSPWDIERDVQAVSKFDASTVRKVIREEQPQHKVTIDRAFAVAKYPVTKAEFRAFVQEAGYSPASGCVLYETQYHISPQASWRLPGFFQTDRDPVVCVSWQDADAYVGWLNKKISKSAISNDSARNGLYRLPSEAEWEYAARAGTRTTRWWGDSIGRGNADCARCGSRWDQEKTAPVGSFRPNPFGLYDVLGNVSQWTEDCWNKDYVGAPVDGGPRTAGDCKRRVARGGNWTNFPWVLRSAARSGFRSQRYNFLSFRVAKAIGSSPQ